MDAGGALVLARAVFFAAAMATFGSALFPFYAVPKDDRGEMARRIRLLVAGAALVALLSALAWLALVTVEFGGVDLASFISTATTVLFETDFGPVWLVRLAAAFLLIFAPLSRAPPAAILAVATVVLGSQASIGHSAVGGPMHWLIQIAHLFAAGAWLGGLLPLAHVLAQITKEQANDVRAQRILVRFSTMGMVSVGLIAYTGVLNTSQVIDRIPSFSHVYDQILLVKVALFLAMVLVAIFNRLLLLPRLDAPANPRGLLLRWLKWSVLLEQGLGLAVLVAASILGRTSPQA